jgi:peptidoglycan/LPS O-acetylase OafA/YrhL
LGSSLRQGRKVILNAADNMQRYVALDSLRGICALAVVLFHFRTTGSISNLGFVRNSWMFVDFFFVLSGFVISAAYAQRFAERRVSVLSFMGLRMGRIYPLHFAVLVAMVAMEVLLILFDFSEITTRHPFEDGRSLTALAGNLILIHAFGIYEALTWNAPSWSIAGEIWIYLLFAFIFSLTGRYAFAILITLGIIALAWLTIASPEALNTTYALGFVRCLYGFSVGTAVFWLTNRGIGLGGTLAEVGAIFLVTGFVALVSSGVTTLVAPLVFALPVLIFAQEKGKIGHILVARPFTWLGTISYSTYMIHGFVQARIGDLIKVAGQNIGLALEASSATAEFPSEVITGNPLIIDMLTFAMVLIVIGCASLTYFWIEQPCRRWSRRLIERTEHVSVTR